MRYCSKCGRKLDAKEKFCPGCGEKVNKTSTGGNHPAPGGSAPVQSNVYPAEPQKPDGNSVQYVYVNKKNGRITRSPHVKTSSEGCLQYLGVALAAVALVIVMVAGSVALAGYLSGKSSYGNNVNAFDFDNGSEPSSIQDAPEVSSEEPVSSQPVSSQEVSSEPAIPEELTAKYLQSRIKGKWRTDVPYKSMSLPGTFEFDGKGKCKCTIKAFLFSKKFEGTYTIKDGGECRLTLDGMDEYLDDDTMVGQLQFITDDKFEFTVDNTVWKLNRVE